MDKPTYTFTFEFANRASYFTYVADYKTRAVDIEQRIRETKRIARTNGHEQQSLSQSRLVGMRKEATKLYAERVASNVRAGELRAQDLRVAA